MGNKTLCGEKPGCRHLGDYTNLKKKMWKKYCPDYNEVLNTNYFLKEIQGLKLFALF